MGNVEVQEYDLIYAAGQSDAFMPHGWYIQETPSGRISQFFNSRIEALEAFEEGRLELAH